MSLLRFWYHIGFQMPRKQQRLVERLRHRMRPRSTYCLPEYKTAMTMIENGASCRAASREIVGGGSGVCTKIARGYWPLPDSTIYMLEAFEEQEGLYNIDAGNNPSEEGKQPTTTCDDSYCGFFAPSSTSEQNELSLFA